MACGGTRDTKGLDARLLLCVLCGHEFVASKGEVSTRKRRLEFEPDVRFICMHIQVAEGIQTLIKVLSKSMDSSLTVEKVELATVTRDDAASKVRAGRWCVVCMAQCWPASRQQRMHVVPPACPQTRASFFPTVQVLYKVYESAELQPYLDAANAEKEAGTSTS